MFGLSHGQKGHFSENSIKSNLCLSCPKPLVKMTIPFCQCGYFHQVGPSEKSRFLVVHVQLGGSHSVCMRTPSYNYAHVVYLPPCCLLVAHS